MTTSAYTKSPMPDGCKPSAKALASIKPKIVCALAPAALALLNDCYTTPICGSVERQVRLKQTALASSRLCGLANGGYLKRIKKSGKLVGFEVTNKGLAAIGKPLIDEAPPAVREGRICPSSMRATLDPARDLHGGRVGLAMYSNGGRRA